MKPRLFVLLFIAGLILVLGIIAAACGDEDDGGESDEDAIRNVVQEVAAAVNDRDFDRLAESITANFNTTTAFQIIMDDPDFRLENFEILSVTVAGDEATVLTTTTEDGQTDQDTVLLKREDGYRWLVDIIR